MTFVEQFMMSGGKNIRIPEPEELAAAQAGFGGAPQYGAPQQYGQPQYASAQVKCPECGGTIVPGKKFCPECGVSTAPRKVKCAACGAELDGTPKFCPECGGKLEA